MKRREIGGALIGAAAYSALRADPAAAQSCTPPCYAQTSQESAAGVVPANTAYLPGDVRRYGADPLGSLDSTSPLLSAIKTGYSLYFCDGQFLTSGNLSPKSGTTWWGTGTLKSSSTGNALVTVSRISDFRFEIDTDLSANTAVQKVAVAIDGATYITIAGGRHVQGAISVAPTAACSHITIEDNVLVSTALGNNTSTAAILVDVKSSDFSIIGNDIESATGAGIAVYNASCRGIISRNRCTSCIGCGIYVNSGQYLVIDGNICYGNQQSGIGLNTATAGSYGYASFCTVSANICAGNLYDGIDYNIGGDGSSHATFSTMSGNVLANNGSNSTGGTGIYLAGADEATIVGNVMAGNNQPGVYLNGSLYCTVTGNGVIANGSGMTSGTGTGITVSGSDNTITGNTSTNNGGAANQAYGVDEISGNNNCIVGNTVNNNTRGGLNLVGANTNAQANQPAIVEKFYYADLITSYTTPSTAGVPNGSLWLNPGAGYLYVLQSGGWVQK